MAKLPNSDRCIVERRKILEYLLDSSRMPAAAKARFFLSCGFTREGWSKFAESLKTHAIENSVVNVTVSVFGTKYEIEGPLNCPDSRSPGVRTVWQIDGDGLAPRLITAYPVIQ